MDIRFKNWNKEIYITELYQEKTYLGLLEGYPNSKINKEIIERAKIDLCKKFYNPITPLMITPNFKKIEIENPSDYQKIHVPKKLPDITCAMMLESVAINDEYDMSSLLVIWFQNEFCLPINDEVLNLFKSIEWSSYSFGYNV